MLIDFSVKNYKSIKDTLYVDMNYSQRAPKGYLDQDTLYFTDVKKNRIIPLLAIYGANASGKTNIINSMASLKAFVVNDCNAREMPFPYTPHILSESTRNDSTEYTIIIEKNGNIYKYLLAFTADNIINEAMYKINSEGSENLIFDVKDKEFNIKVDSSYNLKTIYENECDYISSFLVKLATKYVGFSMDVNNVYDFIKHDFEVYPSNNFHESFVIDRAKVTNADDLSKAVGKILRILSNMDIHLEGVNCYHSDTIVNRSSVGKSEPQKLEIQFDSFKSKHKDDQGQDVEFDFLTQESNGTVTLFGLVGVIIDVLDRGKTLVIDEIERSLHSDIVRYIMKMFRNKRINKKGAQLICASHDLHSLNDLKKSEIAVIRKINNATILRYMSEFEVRNALNFRKNYLAGRFGGIPKIVFDTNVMED
jgi:AAA15 family ATPase/GTPase